MPEAQPRPEPFVQQTDPAALEDLRARLRATRWPDAPEDAGWSLGTDLAYLRELVAYWADDFDWPAQEAALARLPRFRVPLGGLGIHFVHARAVAPAGPRPAAGPQPWLAGLVLALLESHPAPHRPRRARCGSGRRVRRGRARHSGLRILRPPCRPAPRLDRRRRPVGRAHERPRLRAVRRGGRGPRQSREPLPGRSTTPTRVVAVHRTDGGPAVFTGDPADLAPEERAWIEAATAWGATEGAYAAIHRTKPQTAAFGLTRLTGRPRRLDPREAPGLERLRR